MPTTFTTIQQALAAERVDSDKLNASPASKSQARSDSGAGLSSESDAGSNLDQGSEAGSFVSALTENDIGSALGNDSALGDDAILGDDSTLGDNSAAADSAMTNDSALADIDNDNNSGLADEDTKTSHPVDEICMATKECVTGSGHHRQVISHIFGRNKKCTRGLAGHWIMWCRQHYQRFCYRASKEGGNWALSQLSLARAQLQKFEDADIVRDWSISLRKREQDALDVENTALLVAGAVTATGTDTVWERFLVPFCGHGKTFAEVRDVLDAIEEEFETPEYMAREKKKKVFPGVEFLPTFPEAKKQKEAAKVTVDKPTSKAASTKTKSTKAASTKSASTKAANTKATSTKAASTKNATSKPTTTPTKQALAPRLGSFKRKAPFINATAYDATKSPPTHHKKRRLARASDVTEAKE